WNLLTMSVWCWDRVHTFLYRYRTSLLAARRSRGRKRRRGDDDVVGCSRTLAPYLPRRMSKQVAVTARNVLTIRTAAAFSSELQRRVVGFPGGGSLRHEYILVSKRFRLQPTQCDSLTPAAEPSCDAARRCCR